MATGISNRVEWTNERCEQLDKLLKEGKSRKEIAAFFGIGRNQLAGAVWRLRVRQKSSVLPVKRAPPAMTKSPPIQPQEPKPPKGVPLVDARQDQCRAIIGRWDGLALFCGKKTIANTSWCEHHIKLYYTRGRTYA
jgi:hypothetical protein